MVFSQ
jgi:hypothetical protein